MDQKTLDKAERATKGKSGVQDGPQEETQFPRATPGQQPFLRPSAPNPTTESNK